MALNRDAFIKRKGQRENIKIRIFCKNLLPNSKIYGIIIEL